MSKHKLITQLEDLIERHRAGLGAVDTATLTEAVKELKKAEYNKGVAGENFLSYEMSR